MHVVYATNKQRTFEFYLTDKRESVPLGAKVLAICDGIRTILNQDEDLLDAMTDDEHFTARQMIHQAGRLEIAREQRAQSPAETPLRRFFCRLLNLLGRANERTQLSIICPVLADENLAPSAELKSVKSAPSAITTKLPPIEAMTRRGQRQRSNNNFEEEKPMSYRMRPNTRTIKQLGSLIRLLLVFTFCLFAFATAAQASTFTVTTIADNGDNNNPTPGGLREAVINANLHQGKDTIAFQINGSSRTITLFGALPTITDPVIIDGSTQPGFPGVPIIELNGYFVSGQQPGLNITAGDSAVKGLIIYQFSGSGIYLSNKGGNSVTSCYIGADRSGTKALGNKGDGITIESSNNLIGGILTGHNLISGNANNGISIALTGNGNIVEGNLIGTDDNGVNALPNGSGIAIEGSNNTIGGTAKGSGNVVSGNNTAGISIFNPTSMGNVVQGNYIGTNYNGSAALGNKTSGILVQTGIGANSNTVIGGSSAGAGNVISANGAEGIDLANVVGVSIQGNLIGTDVTGKLALGNASHGISIQSKFDKSATIGNSSAATSRNIISGNGKDGINIGGSDGVVIQNNYIGTDITGNAALGNKGAGIVVNGAITTFIGGSSTGASNVISANGDSGISTFEDESTRVMGNHIGCGANATSALGNGGDGVHFYNSRNDVVGGVGNLIAFNKGAGVYRNGGSSTISGNSITSNAGLGIDIEPRGVTPNSPNNSLNYPTITSAYTYNTYTEVQFVLDSTPNTKLRIEFFTNSLPDDSGYGEGATYLGYADVTTGPDGHDVILTSAIGLFTNKFITATVTDPLGNTSEFSSYVKVDAPLPTVSVSDLSISEGNTGTKNADLAVTLDHPYLGTVIVQYETADGTAKAPEDYVATSGTLTFSPGQTTQSISIPVNGDTQSEPNETFRVYLSNPAGAISGNIGTVTILNDDAKQSGALQFSAASYSVKEDGGQATIAVKRTGGSSGAVSVKYATVAGGTATLTSDCTLVVGQLDWADGDTADKTFTVPIIDDTLSEPDETVNLALSNPAGGATLGSTSTAVLTIDDNDAQGAPTIQFSASDYSVQEGLTAKTITVTRTGDSSATATVDYATTDGTATQRGDYEIAAGTLTFSPGETTKTFDVLINQDSYAEGNETINLTLSNATGATLGQQGTAVLTIIDDAVEQTTNPNDDAQSFVHQHYHDFLNREPDAGGLAYWTAQITQCGNDLLCLNTQRKNVSSAYYIENEFQQTGYFIYRVHKAAFGTQPGYEQFMADRSLIVPGQNLSQSQQSFAASFVQRQSFLQAYPASMSVADYVNRLYDNAGLVVDAQEKQQEMDAMLNGNKSRADVLLDVVDRPEFMQREYNPSFVLMQYFGYLRRDPDAGGYQFWLNVLNTQLPNDASGYHSMVCAFITSAEYQDRFSSIHTHSNAECGP